MPRRRFSFARTGRPHLERAAAPAPAPERSPTPVSHPLASAGNHATGRLLAGGATPLRVGAAADRFEAEAKAMSGRSLDQGARARAPGLGEVSADGSGQVSPDLAARIRGATGGRPLPEGVKRLLEAEHRAALGGVRVHTGPEAEALTHAVGARAMTLDNRIFYGRGASPSDLSLTSEEVVHTMQQGATATGRSVGRAPKGVIQRDLTIESSHKSMDAYKKDYVGSYDTVMMGEYGVMTPDSKKSIGTTALATCIGLVVATETKKGWVAALHHAPGGSADLPEAYKILTGMVRDAARAYGGAGELKYLAFPGQRSKLEMIAKYEKSHGKLDNDWASISEFESGTSFGAVTLDKVKYWGWRKTPGLKIGHMRV